MAFNTDNSAVCDINQIMEIMVSDPIVSIVCDAAYLELALRLQIPIATQDAALMEAARAAGVGLVK